MDICVSSYSTITETENYEQTIPATNQIDEKRN